MFTEQRWEGHECFALTAQMVHHLKIDMFKRDFEMGQRFHVWPKFGKGKRKRVHMQYIYIVCIVYINLQIYGVIASISLL